MNYKLEKEILNRLVRIESKLVRGFEELGVNIDKDDQWITLDEESAVVYVSTLGRSMIVLLSDMARAGANKEGKQYDIVHRGDIVGTITFRKIT